MSRLFKQREGTATQEGILGASKPCQADPRGRCCQELDFTETALITPEEPCLVEWR